MSVERPCQVCQHPDRAAIDQALINGKGQREVARMFGIGSGVFGTDTFRADHKKVQRHLDKCMAGAYQAVRQETKVEAGTALIQRMDHLDAVVDETLGRLRSGVTIRDENGPMLDEDGRPVVRFDERTLLAAVREARRNVDMRARLAGIMPEGDADAAEAARLALESSAARLAIAQAEAVVAREAAARRSPERG